MRDVPVRDPPVFRPRAARWHVRPALVAAAGLAAFLALAGLSVVAPLPMGTPPPFASAALAPRQVAERAVRAEETTRRGHDVLWHAKAQVLGGATPGDRSGLIGQELTPLVTTLGSLEAKKLSTSPAWARVLTERLAAEGIGPGSVVAASLSGSFPGLNLALAAACQALDARLVAVSSVTASAWGANEPGFTWPEMEARLVEAGVIAAVSVAVTAGGGSDRADDLAPEDRELAERIRDAAATRLSAAALRPATFDEAVAARVRAYRRAAAGAPIALYANVGGADASLGRSPAILGLGAGFVHGPRLDRGPGGGVTAWFAAQRVPILMLLNVRELAVRWGIGL